MEKLGETISECYELKMERVYMRGVIIMCFFLQPYLFPECPL